MHIGNCRNEQASKHCGGVPRRGTKECHAKGICIKQKSCLSKYPARAPPKNFANEALQASEPNILATFVFFFCFLHCKCTDFSFLHNFSFLDFLFFTILLLFARGKCRKRLGGFGILMTAKNEKARQRAKERSFWHKKRKNTAHSDEWRQDLSCDFCTLFCFFVLFGGKNTKRRPLTFLSDQPLSARIASQKYTRSPVGSMPQKIIRQLRKIKYVSKTAHAAIQLQLGRGRSGSFF